MIRFERLAFLEKAIKTDYIMKLLFNHLFTKSLAIFNRKIIFPTLKLKCSPFDMLRFSLFGYFSTTILVIKLIYVLFLYLPIPFEKESRDKKSKQEVSFSIPNVKL